MSHSLVSILLFFSFFSTISENWKISDCIDSAEELYDDQKYEASKSQLFVLRDSLVYWKSGNEINLGHCDYRLLDFDTSLVFYMKGSLSENNLESSIAFHQAGLSYFFKNKGEEILKSRSGSEENIKTVKETLVYLKKSLLKNANNEKARYNYELLSMVLREVEEKEQKSEENKDQKNDKKENEEKKDGDKNKDEDKEGDKKGDDSKKSDEQKRKNDDKGKDGEEQEDKEGKSDKEQKKDKNQEGKGQSQKEKEAQEKQAEEEEIRRRLKANGMSKEKTEQVMKSMDDAQLKYLQQQKRKNNRSEDSNKPQW